MVKCVCGKEISTVPDWLIDVKVQFVCNNCPNRELQGITQVDLTGGKVEEEPPKKDVMEPEEPDEDDIDLDDEPEP
jgi:hypothetical protein